MSRGPLTDYLQEHTFWLMDFAPVGSLSAPLFLPMAGFSSISSPEMQLETKEVPDGNWPFRRTVVVGAKVSPVRLARGVTAYDSDFYRWGMAAAMGDTGGRPNSIFRIEVGGPTPRRTLLLIQFMAHTPGPTRQAAEGIAFAASMTGLMASAATMEKSVVGGIRAASVVGVPVLNELEGGAFEFKARVPAKAWVLSGCIPTRWKAGGDFDAKSAEISIAEIEVQPDMIEEVSLAA